MKETLLKSAALLWLLGTYISMLATFVTAYLHPSKSVTVVINRFSEANTELVVLIIGSVIIFWATPLIFSDMRKRFRERIAERFIET